MPKLNDYETLREMLGDVWDTAKDTTSGYQKQLVITSKLMEILQLLEQYNLEMRYGKFVNHSSELLENE
jgi:hypothetical protein